MDIFKLCIWLFIFVESKIFEIWQRKQNKSIKSTHQINWENNRFALTILKLTNNAAHNPKASRMNIGPQHRHGGLFQISLFMMTHCWSKTKNIFLISLKINRNRILKKPWNRWKFLVQQKYQFLGTRKLGGMI